MKKSKPVISWDFDGTLYNPYKGSLIKETYKIFKEQADSRKYNMVVTTFRAKKWCKEIKKLLPEVDKIIATNSWRKAPFIQKELINKGYNVIKHYDDDRDTIYDLAFKIDESVYVYDDDFWELPIDLNIIRHRKKEHIKNLKVNKRETFNMKHFILQKNVYFYGDIHNYPWNIIDKIKTHKDGSAHIILGDIGLGFKLEDVLNPSDELKEVMLRTVKFLQECLIESNQQNSMIYLFRGNHDDPFYFTNEEEIDKIHIKYPNIRIIRDFEEVEFANGKEGIVIPGGISIDRSNRIKNCSYWSDELIHYDKLDNVNRTYDFILSHSGPVPISIQEKDKRGCPSIVTYYANWDSELLNTITIEADFWLRAIEKIKPANIYCGHYHVSEVNKLENYEIRFLNIDEEFKY